MDAAIAATEPPAAPMPRWRVWLVLAVAFVLVFGHAYDIITQVEHWPFSYYPMYGRVQKKRLLRVPALYGVMYDGKREKGQRITRSYVPQLSEARIRNILIAAWGRDGSARNAKRNTAAILHDYIKLYESRRIAGLIKDDNGNPAPSMVEAQLVQLTWVVRSDAASKRARNVDAQIGVRLDGKIIDYDKQRRATATTPSPGTPGEGGGEGLDE